MVINNIAKTIYSVGGGNIIGPPYLQDEVKRPLLSPRERRGGKKAPSFFPQGKKRSTSSFPPRERRGPFTFDVQFFLRCEGKRRY